MSHFYFFKNDEKCQWMKKEINYYLPKILHEQVSIEDINQISGLKLINNFNGKIKFYLILKWITGKERGANIPWLDEIGVNYINSIEELPKNSGVYIAGYDSNISEVQETIDKGIPIIDHACPWVRQLKKQIINIPDSHQAVLLIDKGHMVYNCYNILFPDDIIILSNENYENEIKSANNGKPLYLIIYATYRIKEVTRIISFINKNYHNDNNILNNYKKTLCCWSNQGLLEEIENEVKNQCIRDVWVICSNTQDRSTKSIINEIEESGAKALPIKNHNEIPEKIQSDSRIGVLIAPIPVAKNILDIKNIIKKKFVSKD